MRNVRKILLPFLLIATSLLFVFGNVPSQESAEEAFEKALYYEDVQGDLQKAIGLYDQILKQFPENREIAAKAQLHIGLCYEKIGLKDAEGAYLRVIENFPEQTDEVAMARDRLTGIERSLAKLERQPKFRKIEIASKPQNGVLSPDGKKLAFISDGAVWVVPLHGKVDSDIAGEPVRLTDVEGIWDNGSLMAWSADGKWIAVNSSADDKDTVHVIPVAGGEPRVVQAPNRGGHAWSYRLSLSPDGQKVAVSALALGTRQEVPESHNRYIYTIPTAGGAPKQVSSSQGRLPSFSPDGEFIVYAGFRVRDDSPENKERLRFESELWIVSAKGGTAIKLANLNGRLRGPVWSPDRRFIAAHHEPGGTNDSKEIWVYPLSPDASSASEPFKISLPRSSWNMPAGWTPHNELGVFIQSELHSAIYTVSASGGKAVQVTPEPGGYYPRWSPDGERIYLRGFDEEEEKVTTLYVPAVGGDPVEIPVEPERWLVSRVPGGGLDVSPDGKKIVISAYQEPYERKEGVDIWTIPVKGGRPTRLTSDGSFEGYPCWSPDGKWIAFTDWHEKSEDEGINAIYVIPAEGGEIRQITSEADNLDGGAIAFSPDGELIAFFSEESIKTIPFEGGQSEVLVAEVKSAGHSQLAYSPDGSKIAHNAGGKIWITQLDGGAPEELGTGLPEGARLNEVDWSPDGEKIAFMVRIGGEPEFWFISDFLSEEK